MRWRQQNNTPTAVYIAAGTNWGSKCKSAQIFKFVPVRYNYVLDPLTVRMSCQCTNDVLIIEVWFG